MEQMCRKMYQPFWLILLAGIFFFVLFGAERPAHALEQEQIPLVKLNVPGIVSLDGNDDGYTVKVPLSRRRQIQEATLHLAYVNSTALLAERSRLLFLFNDYPLGEVTLEPQAPEGKVTISIPGRLFVPGYNDLQIRVAQDFKDHGCIPPDPPEVWTRLLFIDSTLEFSYTSREVPLSLASVADFLFDPKDMAKQQVHIVTRTMDKDDLYRAAITAAAVALRYEYRSVRFSTGRDLLPGLDNIVIGDHDFVQQVTGQVALQDDLGILPMPSAAADKPDRYHGLLYLSGAGPEEIGRSVEAFSVLSLPLPDLQSCTVRDVLLPVITPYSGRNRLEPEKKYTFKELGFTTTTYHGFSRESGQITFTLPAELFLAGNRDILVRLDLAYAASMREDSVLSLNINSKFVSSVPLELSRGGQYRGYAIRLPLRFLNAGTNVLNFHPVLTPLHTSECEMIQGENLALTLFDSSTIEVPKLLHWVTLPQLSYLFDDGFPLTIMPDFSRTTLFVPEKESSTVSAALNIIAGISQRTGVLPYGLTVADTLGEQETNNLLVVGARAALPAEITAGLKPEGGIAMPVYGRLPGTLQSFDWRDRLAQWLFDDTVNIAPVIPDKAIFGSELRLGPKQAVLTEFESPFTPMQSVVLLTAEHAEDVLLASEVLQDYEVKQQCRDGFVVLDFKEKKPAVRTAALIPSYGVGKITLRSRMTYLIDKYRWSFIWAVGGLIILLALVLTVYMKRRGARRLQVSDSEDE